MRINLLTLFFILLFNVHTVYAAPVNKEVLKQQVIALDIKRGEALKNKDMAFLEKVYADDWIYMTPWGINFTKSQYFKEINHITYKKLDYKYLNARCPNENTVILSLINSVEFTKADKTIKEDFFYTRIYKKRNGRWKFVTQHGEKK